MLQGILAKIISQVSDAFPRSSYYFALRDKTHPDKLLIDSSKDLEIRGVRLEDLFPTQLLHRLEEEGIYFYKEKEESIPFMGTDLYYSAAFSLKGNTLSLYCGILSRDKLQAVSDQSIYLIKNNMSLIERMMREFEGNKGLIFSEISYKNLIDASLDIYLVEFEQSNGETYCYINPAFEQILGLPRDNLKHKSVRSILESIVHPDDLGKVIVLFEMVKSERLKGNLEPFEFELRLLDKSCRAIWFHLRTYPQHNEEGRSIGTTSVLRDINDYKDLQSYLEEQRIRLESLIVNAPCFIFLKDNEGRYVVASELYGRLWGLSPVQMIGKRDDHILTQKQYLSFRDKESKLSREVPEVYIEDEVWRDRDGRRIYVSFHRILLFNSSNQEIGILGLGKDKTKDRTVQDLNLLLTQVIEDSVEGILSCNSLGKIVFVNSACRGLLGLSQDDVILGRGIKEFLPQGIDLLALRKRIKKEETTSEFSIKHKSGKGITISLTAFTVSSPSSGEKHYVALLKDITKRKEFENRLKIQTEKAKQSNQYKSQLLTFITHELRNPLHNLLGFVTLLKDSEITQSQRDEYFSTVDSSLKRIGEITNELIDFTKIDSGRAVLEKVRFNLHSLIRSIFQLGIVPATKQGISCRLNIQDGLIEEVVGDAAKLKSILLNLLENSTKFTSTGEIILDVGLDRLEKKGKVWIEFRVRDTGIGIPEEHLGDIFEPYQQLHTSSEHLGLGLGLSIIKELVNLVSGTIKVESILNKGSTFIVRIPFDIPESKSPIDTERHTEEGKDSILCVDDDPLSLALLGEFLQIEGYKVYKATQGSEALNLLKSDRIDLVILDLYMPEQDGFDILRVIREDEHLSSLPVIALTAAIAQFTKEEILNSGFTDILPKPFKREELLRLVHNLLK